MFKYTAYIWALRVLLVQECSSTQRTFGGSEFYLHKNVQVYSVHLGARSFTCTRMFKYKAYIWALLAERIVHEIIFKLLTRKENVATVWKEGDIL
jgi:hypothetical protein